MIFFILQCFAALLIADAITGYIHYIEDEHPQWIRRLLGDWGTREIIQPNIEHHKEPYVFTQRSYWERNNTSIYAAIPVVLLAYWAKSDFLLLLALTGSQANQVHYYAHLPNCEIPSLILLLQSLGILQSKRHHSLHHAPPHDTRFCVMTPWINSLIGALRPRLQQGPKA